MTLANETLFSSSCESKGNHKICRSRGGESCALDGALIVLQPIADAAHIIHGPITCCSYSWDGRGARSDKGPFLCKGLTTDMNELDIVYGGIEKLKEAITEVIKKHNPSGVFVYATCISGLTGEDIESACSDITKRLGKTVVPVIAPGFVGPKNLGNRIAGDALLRYVIGTKEPSHPTDDYVNIIGEYNIAGDMDEIEDILTSVGLKVLSRITGKASFDEIRYAHRARLNLLFCGRALINVAEAMESKYNIDYVDVSFYGPTEITKSLRTIAKKFNNPTFEKNVDSAIGDLRSKVEEGLKDYEILKGKKAVLYSGGLKSWSLISALRDMGIEVSALITKKSSYEDEKKAKELLRNDAIVTESSDASSIRRLLNETKAEILIAGGRNKYLAIKENIPFVDVNQERERKYAGIKGFFNLADDITKALLFYGNLKKNFIFPVPKIVNNKKSHSEDPFKLPSTLGAALAFQGIDKTVPIIHGAQGCSFLSKVMLIRHFCEPIVINTTKLFSEEVILGSEERLEETISDVINKQKPELISVLSSSLSEVRGALLESAVRKLDNETKIVTVATPDYEGGLEEGYAKAIESLITLSTNEQLDIPKNKSENKINVILGSHLTPADFNEIRYILEDFGLYPVMIPDLACLDGSRESFSGLTCGGTSLKDILSIKDNKWSIVVGLSLEGVGKKLKELTGIGYTLLDNITGLSGTENFLNILQLLSKKNTNQRIERERKVFLDLLKDAQFHISDKKVSMALESDQAIQFSRFLTECGMKVTKCVIPNDSLGKHSICAEEVIIGDLTDLDIHADIWIANSRARHLAKKFNIPLLQYGYPSYSDFGHAQRTTIGYKGSINLLREIVNKILGGEL